MCCLLSVFSAHPWVFVRPLGNPSWFRNYKSPSEFPSSWEACHPQKQRFSHLAREWKEVGTFGWGQKSENVPAYTGSRAVCLTRCRKAWLALPQPITISNVASKNLSCVFSGRSTSKLLDSCTLRSNISVCPYNRITTSQTAKIPSLLLLCRCVGTASLPFLSTPHPHHKLASSHTYKTIDIGLPMATLTYVNSFWRNVIFKSPSEV